MGDRSVDWAARRTVGWFQSVLHRYSLPRVLLLIVSTAGFLVVLFLIAPPSIGWAVLGFVGGVFAEDMVRGAADRVGRGLRRCDSVDTPGIGVRFGGVDWPADIVELPPGGMRLNDVDILIESGELEVPGFVRDCERTLSRIIEEFPLPSGITFDNNQCLIPVESPRILRIEEDDRELPVAQFRVRRSRYFVKAIARGGLPAVVLDHVRRHWPANVIDPEDVRSHLLAEVPDDSFHPLRHPNLGVALAPIIDDAGSLYTAWQRRGDSTAINGGRLGVPINEALMPGDQDDHSSRVDMKRALLRAIGEEIGKPPDEPELGVTGVLVDVDGNGRVDRNGMHCGGGVVIIGWARFRMDPHQFTILPARDYFERGTAEVVPLTVAALHEALTQASPSSWFAPAVAALVTSLEWFRPGGRLQLDRSLRRAWKPADDTGS
jgi:hypothetical protein